MTRLIGATRGDPLARYLFAALERRYGALGRLDVELRPWQRYAVALATFHPHRRRWQERFFKSVLACELRSRNCAEGVAKLARKPAAIVQVHALFRSGGAPSIVYVDNTHRQSAEGWPPWNPLRGRALQRWYAFERATYEQAQHLFTMGEPAARSLVEDYGIPQERVSNVGAGANFEQLPPLPAAGREPTVLFIGNDFERKGGATLLEAFRLVRAQLPHAHLQIVGAVEPTAEPGVTVFGRINDRDRIADLYSRASVFCLPSFFDPYPLVLMEAMAYGLPCVSTTVGAIGEEVVDGETGLLVSPGDAGALAGALKRLLTNPAEAARFGLAGRRRVEQELNWDRVVGRMAPVLDPLMQPESGSRPSRRPGVDERQPEAVTAR
jgi:glycosyltransferase involved in cell wall biosynthesis